MLGYWNNPEATREIISSDGWLNSGDTARIDGDGRIYITGRLKEIIVMSNGEKISPSDMEAAIARDRLFQQVILLGEGRPYLSLIAVLDPQEWSAVAAAHGLHDSTNVLASQAAQDLVLERVAAQLVAFPGYAQVRRVLLTLEPWTIDNGLMTPTLKLRRVKVMERFNAEIDRMYEGH
jgi:long-chain acyl-CoA synthetase